jgi:hypothetical protein
VSWIQMVPIGISILALLVSISSFLLTYRNIVHTRTLEFELRRQEIIVLIQECIDGAARAEARAVALKGFPPGAQETLTALKEKTKFLRESSADVLKGTDAFDALPPSPTLGSRMKLENLGKVVRKHRKNFDVMFATFDEVEAAAKALRSQE